MSTNTIRPANPAERKKRRPLRTVAALCTAVAAAGATWTVASPANAAWLGGVHYAYSFTNGTDAWNLLESGPTQEGYDQMLKDCQSMGGTTIAKAGTGSVRDNGKGEWDVRFDFSCASDDGSGAPEGGGKQIDAIRAFDQLVTEGTTTGGIDPVAGDGLHNQANNLVLELSHGSDVTAKVGDVRRVVNGAASCGEVTQDYGRKLNVALTTILNS
jgi:hypothetical protein